MNSPPALSSDHNGQQLAHVYFEDEPGRRSAAKLLTKDFILFIQLVLYAFGALENFALTIQTAVHGTSRVAHETAGATT